MIIAIDIDDVVLNLIPEWLKFYNAVHNDSLTQEQITDWDMTKFVKPECGKKIYDFLLEPKLYDDVNCIPGAWSAILRLRNLGHRLIFVTASHHSGKLLRMKNLELLPNEKEYVACHDKSLIRADVLIDDKPQNLENFGGHKILFSRSHNYGEGRFPRAEDWGDVLAIIGRMHRDNKRVGVDDRSVASGK